MSADNYVAIRQVNGLWHVWMVLGGYDADDWEKPSGSLHQYFDNEVNAWQYARKMDRDEHVEYGIRPLDPIVLPIDKKPFHDEWCASQEYNDGGKCDCVYGSFYGLLGFARVCWHWWSSPSKMDITSFDVEEAYTKLPEHLRKLLK